MKFIISLLFITSLRTSFGVEERKLKRKRYLNVELDPISKEEAGNDFELSPGEESKLDRFLQQAFPSMSYSMPFTTSPSNIATSSPTASPTITLSLAPSSMPTVPYVCPIDTVVGRTFTFAAANFCFRLGLYDGGVLEADTTDKTCSNTVFKSTAVFSFFDSIDVGSNKAVYAVGPAGYSGTVEIKETPSATMTRVKILKLNSSTKEFAAQVIIASCASEPSQAPSFLPTTPPSLAPVASVSCQIDAFVGETFYFAAINYCFRVVIGTGGQLVADTTDPACSKEVYTPTAVFSNFDSIDTVLNLAVYSKGPLGYSGTIAVRETPSALKTELKLIKLDGPNKVFEAALIIPSCDGYSS